MKDENVSHITYNVLIPKFTLTMYVFGKKVTVEISIDDVRKILDASEGDYDVLIDNGHGHKFVTYNFMEIINQ